MTRLLPIDADALIGDCRGAALVGRNGSIDWLCWPHSDSDACFAAALGTPANGIREVRGERRHFKHSKLMAWVAVDSAARDAEEFGFDAPLERWRDLRDAMHRAICEKGFDEDRDSFTQSFDSPALDAGLLLMLRLDFLPTDDPRIVGTVAAVETDLPADGLVLRYRTDDGADGLPAGEGAFLPRTVRLATAYGRMGRGAEARALFERLLALRNDLGLLAEEYDPKTRRQIGDFPQAFSHLALVGTALAFAGRSLAPSPAGSPT